MFAVETELCLAGASKFVVICRILYYNSIDYNSIRHLSNSGLTQTQANSLEHCNALKGPKTPQKSKQQIKKQCIFNKANLKNWESSF